MRLRGGNFLPCVTSALAPTMLSSPISQPLSSVLPMPMRQRAPMMAPCTITPCPTTQSGPIDDGEARVGVRHRVVLEAGVAAEQDALDVAAQDGARPDVGAVLEHDVADDRSRPGGRTHPAAKTGTLSPNAWMDMPGVYRRTHMKFVHVATRTKDLDAAIAFYEALGMTERAAGRS